MPDEEPRVAENDAAPGAAPESTVPEQVTLSSGASSPTTSAIADAVVPPGDEWDGRAAEASGQAEDDAGGEAELTDAAVPIEPADEEEPADATEPADGAEPSEATVATATDAEDAPGVDVDPGAGVDAPPADDVTTEATPPGDAPDSGDAPADPYATGVLEIVSSLDAEGSEGVAEAVVVPAAVAPVPQSAVSPEEETAVEPAAVRARVPWWPFAVYLALWAVGLAYAAYRFLQLPADVALYEQELYGYFMLGGLALTALGPLMIPFVWLLARHGHDKAQRGGLFARTTFWAALSTLVGVALWWLTILVLDQVRLGSMM